MAGFIRYSICRCTSRNYANNLGSQAQRVARRNGPADAGTETNRNIDRVEISHWTKYDYVLVNTDLQTTYAKLKEILDVERMKRQDKSQVGQLVDTLKADLDALTRGR